MKNNDAIDSFMASHPETEKFCEYMALRAANNNLPWNEWTVTEPDPELYKAWRFAEYAFFSQWAQIKKYANSKNISIIGDIPIYVSWDSADVWSSPESFQLDERCNPKSVAGVPPDYFSEDGQLWGNPLYDWKKMKEDNYSWWRRRMSFMFELFDGVRIDHFRGLQSYYSIPASATPSASAPVSGGLQVGNVIEHERFGVGEVVNVVGTGDNCKATVRFRNAGEKQLLLKFARFKIIS